MSLTIVIYFRPFYNWLVTVMGHITGLCSEKDHQLFLRRRHSVFPPLNHVPTTVRSHHAVLLLHTPIEVKHLDVKYHHGHHRISSNRITVQKHRLMKQVFEASSKISTKFSEIWFKFLKLSYAMWCDVMSSGMLWRYCSMRTKTHEKNDSAQNTS